MLTHLAESLATHISLLTTQTQKLAGSGGQDNLLPHLSLLALHNQQLTQQTIQQKESLEELKKENEKVNKDVAKLKESLELKIQELERAQAIVTTKSKHDIEALTVKVNGGLERDQQLTQLTLQQKESIEESQRKIQELEKENEALKLKVNKDNKDVAREVVELKESLEKSQLKIQELEREKQAQAIVTTKSKHDIEALTVKVNEDLE